MPTLGHRVLPWRGLVKQGELAPVPWSVYDLDNLMALSLPAQPTWMPAMLCAEVEKLA